MFNESSKITPAPEDMYLMMQVDTGEWQAAIASFLLIFFFMKTIF